MAEKPKLAASTVIAAGLGAGGGVLAFRSMEAYQAVVKVGGLELPADASKWLVSIIVTLLPVIVQQFAPSLLPFVNWLISAFKLSPELAEYQHVLSVVKANPNCRKRRAAARA